MSKFDFYSIYQLSPSHQLPQQMFELQVQDDTIRKLVNCTF